MNSKKMLRNEDGYCGQGNASNYVNDVMSANDRRRCDHQSIDADRC